MLGLWVAPADAVQGDAQRLMYLHVPAAWLAYLAFGVTALASALWLWPRTRSATWDRLAGASAEVGVIFTGAHARARLALGPADLGHRGGSGTRASSPTAVLFFLYLGYLALRRIPARPERGRSGARSPR